MIAMELKEKAARLMGCAVEDIFKVSDPALVEGGAMRVIMQNGQKFTFTAAEIAAGQEHVVYASMYRTATGRFAAADQQDADGVPEVMKHRIAKSAKKAKAAKAD